MEFDIYSKKTVQKTISRFQQKLKYTYSPRTVQQVFEFWKVFDSPNSRLAKLFFHIVVTYLTTSESKKQEPNFSKNNIQ